MICEKCKSVVVLSAEMVAKLKDPDIEVMCGSGKFYQCECGAICTTMSNACVSCED